MIGVLVILLCASACALWYGISLTHASVSGLRSTVKTGATVMLVAAAMMLGAPALIIAGLLCGAAGDWFLSRHHERGFLPGLATFLLGHVLYLIWAFNAAVSFATWGALQWSGAAVLGLGAAGLLHRIWPTLGRLTLPVVAYALVSLALSWTALALWQSAAVFAAGVMAFVVSDMILALQLFTMTPETPTFRRAATSLWALYWLGQLGILVGSLSLAS